MASSCIGLQRNVGRHQPERVDHRHKRRPARARSPPGDRPRVRSGGSSTTSRGVRRAPSIHCACASWVARRSSPAQRHRHGDTIQSSSRRSRARTVLACWAGSPARSDSKERQRLLDSDRKMATPKWVLPAAAFHAGCLLHWFRHTVSTHAAEVGITTAACCRRVASRRCRLATGSRDPRQRLSLTRSGFDDKARDGQRIVSHGHMAAKW
jgi:hypothetical protein